MKSSLKMLSIAIIVVIVAAALWSTSTIFLGRGERYQAGKIVWVRYEEAWTAAKKLNRPVMLYFHSDRCPACKLLEKDVFGDEETASFLNGNFVCASVNVDKPEGMDLARKYKVLVLPTVIFLSPSGEQLDKIYGYWPPKDFWKVTEAALESFKASSQ
ncbi:MAG: thioredoxin family protein [Candidatus Hecatellaceae archaeon]